MRTIIAVLNSVEPLLSNMVDIPFTTLVRRCYA